MKNSTVRVRFAPSPTGPLHIGGVRTALYNYLFAKQNKGVMILRIEDTDQGRYVHGAEDYIVESLEWCGINIDEGICNGGPYGPYRQSDRKELYFAYADQLVKNGSAYYAFDTPQELETIRKQYESEKRQFQYDIHSRSALKNSLTLTADEVHRKIQDGEHYVIRIKMPENREIIVNDLIRGRVGVHTSILDDKVLFKSDGMPTYHLANVVDDHIMEISHVIRGEEWLPSAPLHVFLYECFGWLESMPAFAHLPLLLKPEGNGKLSKRDGDRLGFPVFPLNWRDPFSGELSSGYRESGYFPEAFINMLALLGWNPGTEQEIFSMEELIAAFSVDRISKAGAKFDPVKARWFNQQYLRMKSDEEIAHLFSVLLEEKGIKTGMDKIIRAVKLVKERVNFIHELWEHAGYFFCPPGSYDEQVVKKRWKEETPGILIEIIHILDGINPFDKQTAHDRIMRLIEEKQYNTGSVMNCLRLCVVGKAMGPDMFEIIDLIGKEECVSRIEKGIRNISHSS